MPILTREDGNLKLGGGISTKLAHKLRSAPDPKAIFDNMEDFNSEVESSHPEFVIHTQEEDEIERNRTEKEEKLRHATPEKPTKPTPKEVRNLSPKKPLKIEKKEVEKEVPVTKEFTQPKEFKKEKPMELEKELEAFDKKVVAKTQESPTDSALGVLLAHPEAPSEKQLALWKKEFGDDGLHITIFSAKEIYVYTHLSRAMWKKVQERMQTVQSQKDTVSEEELQEIVVKYCIKWPVLTVEWQHNSKGGILGALYNAIMLQSYFLTPQQVMAITTDL